MRVRMSDRIAGRPVFFPIRYADDFVVLVSGNREQAEAENAVSALERECDLLKQALSTHRSAAFPAESN